MKRGVVCALLGAALFGLSAPLGKLLLGQIAPQLLGGLLYLGAGIGLGAVRLFRKSSEPALRQKDAPLLGGVILFGGMAGPFLLMWGLTRVSALSGALLLNLEAPFTMILALIFGEHLGRRAALAGLFVVGGSVLLALDQGVLGGQLSGVLAGVLAIGGACACWGLDNNLTQRLSSRDPISIVMWKTLGAGVIVVPLALAFGAHLPHVQVVGYALVLGLFSYGASIVLDVWALRLLGAAREAPLFATAPFVGALAAIPLLGDRPRALDLAAGALMIIGVYLLIRERHDHTHHHHELVHEHAHTHDDPHHQHSHDDTHPQPPPSGAAHSHEHRHDPLTHDHPHTPDEHHRHKH